MSNEATCIGNREAHAIIQFKSRKFLRPWMKRPRAMEIVAFTSANFEETLEL